MTRLISIAAIAASMLAFSGPAHAQARGYYTATAATAPSSAKLVTRSTIWTCADAVCTAPKAGARDPIMCELIARQAGPLTSFSANGLAFDDAALSKCNSRAK